MAEGGRTSAHSSTLDFLFQVGKLKFLKRTGWLKRQIKDCESVAGHMYRMAIMAFFLDDEILDRNRCIKMALVHDMAECIVGDITPFCGVTKEEKHKRELNAMYFLCTFVDEKIGKELISLFMEYEEQKTIEAVSVKDLDKFDMLVQAFEYELGHRFRLDLQDFFDNTKGFHNETVLNWFQDLELQRRASRDRALSSESKKPQSPLSETKRPESHLSEPMESESLLSEPMEPESDMLDFFLLIGDLKHMDVPCSRYIQENGDCESIADHLYLMSIMAFLMDDSISNGLNRDKLIKMALIQNITKGASKTRIFIHTSKEKVNEENMQIMQRICQCMDVRVRQEFLDLLKEYQAQKTLEAKLVKDFDDLVYLIQKYDEASMVGKLPLLSVIDEASFECSEVVGLAKELKILGMETDDLE